MSGGEVGEAKGGIKRDPLLDVNREAGNDLKRDLLMDENGVARNGLKRDLLMGLTEHCVADFISNQKGRKKVMYFIENYFIAAPRIAY
jgi:hypothetical protein